MLRLLKNFDLASPVSSSCRTKVLQKKKDRSPSLSKGKCLLFVCHDALHQLLNPYKEKFTTISDDVVLVTGSRGDDEVF